MKILEQVRQLTVVGDVGDTKKATISVNKMAKLQHLLTKGLYKDPITAVIAEWTNNGVDSVVQSGKDPLDNPVIVSIGQNSRGQSIFSVEDKGTGLDNRDFEDICMNYLESTKESDDSAIGMYGIGMKAFLALERSATFICRKNGKERVYLVYEGEEFVNYDMLVEKDTEEEDGVKAELVIQNVNEKAQFMNKARQKLAYYDTAALVIDGRAEVWEIERNDLFQTSDANKQQNMHICLKDVYYPIDWEALGIPAIPYPIALRFSLTDGIIPTPSRESYISNEKTKKLILERIGQVSDWMVTKYNETVREFETFKGAYQYIGVVTPALYINSKHYPLNSISGFSKIPILKPKVKGITIREPDFYKIKKSELFFEYIPVGYSSSGTYRHHKPNRWNPYSFVSCVFEEYGVAVIVNEGMKGNVREFLKQKYNDALFCRENPVERAMGGDPTKIDYTSYNSILDLHLKQEKEWKPFIKEWQMVRDQVFENMIDERKVEETKEYQDWLEEKRKQARLNRKPGTYRAINKSKGDITISYLKDNSRKGLGWQKYAVKVADLPENHYLSVVIEEDDKDAKETAKVLYRMLGNNKIQFATVGKKEGKKIPKHFQFINFQQFMSRDCKPFMRLASAIVFKKVLEDFDILMKHDTGVLENCLGSLVSDSEKLEKYVDKNLKGYGSDETRNAILAIAEDKDLYDKELWKEYLNIKESIKKFDFIICMAEPDVWDEEEKKRYKKVINQMLLFRKMFHNDLPENITVKYEK